MLKKRPRTVLWKTAPFSMTLLDFRIALLEIETATPAHCRESIVLTFGPPADRELGEMALVATYDE